MGAVTVGSVTASAGVGGAGSGVWDGVEDGLLNISS